MRKGWTKKKLGELCELTRGHNPPKSKFVNKAQAGYVRFYQIRDGWADDYAVFVPDSPQLHKVEPRDVLMVAYRHIGKVFRGVTGAFNVALCKISIKRKDLLDDDFLFYMIPTPIIKGELMLRSERSLIPSMSVEHLKEIEIPIPSLFQQRCIVGILDETFAAIDKAKANVERNLQNARDLFESYLQNVFGNPGDDWEEKRLSDVCNIVGGGTPSKSNKRFYGGDILWATVRDMKSDLITSTEHKITQEAVKQSSTNIIPSGNLVIATRVGLGKACLIKYNTAINQDLKGVLPKNISQVSIEFLFRWFKSKSQEIIQEGTGATVQGVKLTFINSLNISLPPIKEQKIIVKNINNIEEQITNIQAYYQQKLNDLDELKQSLLQKAFAGELTLSTENMTA